jgi:hypothetical protein
MMNMKERARKSTRRLNLNKNIILLVFIRVIILNI